MLGMYKMFLFYHWYRSLRMGAEQRSPVQRGGEITKYRHLCIMGFHNCPFFESAVAYAHQNIKSTSKSESVVVVDGCNREDFASKLATLKNNNKDAKFDQHITCPVIWLGTVREVGHFIGGFNDLQAYPLEDLTHQLVDDFNLTRAVDRK